jgi:exosortase/archaeosortase family protein
MMPGVPQRPTEVRMPRKPRPQGITTRRPGNHGARKPGALASRANRGAVGFVVRFLVGWALAIGILSLVPGIERWTVQNTVDAVLLVLRLVSLKPSTMGATIAVGSATLRIVPECTSLMPTLLLGIAMAAYPSALVWKAIGLSAGIALIWAVNLIRVLALLAVLQWWPNGFEFVHVYLWQTGMLLVVCAFFLAWLRMEPARRANP